MKTIIRKWGNSAGTIIPVRMLDAARIGLGDKVNIEARAGTLVMTLLDEPMTLEDLLAARVRLLKFCSKRVCSTVRWADLFMGIRPQRNRVPI